MSAYSNNEFIGAIQTVAIEKGEPISREDYVDTREFNPDVLSVTIVSKSRFTEKLSQGNKGDCL